MQIEYVKVALITGWMIAVGGLGYGLGTTSASGWTLVAVLSVLPPIFMARLWSAPSQSMSESIRNVLAGGDRR